MDLRDDLRDDILASSRNDRARSGIAMSESETPTAWLVRMSGPLAGMRYAIGAPVVTVGRGAQNDIAVTDSPTVSVRHLEIHKDGDEYKVNDLNSTNGTFVDGARVSEAALKAPVRIQLGEGGPEFTFVLDNTPQVDVDATIVVPRDSVLTPPPAALSPENRTSLEHEDLFLDAVANSHLLRKKGIGDQTLILMRHTLHQALHRTRRKFGAIIAALVITLLGVSAFGAWKIQALKTERSRIETSIQKIEAQLKEINPNQPEANELYDRLNQYEDQARSLDKAFLYRVTMRKRMDPLEQEIKALLEEFGAETYTVPSEFLEETKRFIEQYQGPDRPNIEYGLGQARKQIDAVRAIFEQEHLPADLAYMSIVESASSTEVRSRAGAAGLWQFTPATARAYGLNVTDAKDERMDVRKSTHAACKYIRELILDFGSGSSVMLALAAYNVGPSRVKQAIRRVTDPIKQRNFWYLYRVRALPDETREYVPKVIAVLIIAQHPERYGFSVT
jgi:soluble lytic murein transglycosylase-like protein